MVASQRQAKKKSAGQSNTLKRTLHLIGDVKVEMRVHFTGLIVVDIRIEMYNSDSYSLNFLRVQLAMYLKTRCSYGCL